VAGIDASWAGIRTTFPQPTVVANARGKTLVTNAGSNGKFLAVLDLDVKEGRLRDWRYRLLPVFSNLLPPDPAMNALIRKHRAPYAGKLGERLAVTEGLLYRRGNFNGTADQLIVEALLAEKNAEIAFSPGFRWGTTLLPGEAITLEHLMDQTAITYPYVTLSEFSGRRSRRSSRTWRTISSIQIRTTSKAATWCASAAFDTRSIRRRRSVSGSAR
jgi:sulfur-oxidizing protein SoxB